MLTATGRGVRAQGYPFAGRPINIIVPYPPGGGTDTSACIMAAGRPRGGEVRLNGKVITGQPPSLNIADGLAMVPQGHGIFRTLTMQQNLELGGFDIPTLLGSRIERAYGLFPIFRERHRQIGGTLSGGQQWMLAIGMALLSEPDVLLLDEPSIGLAPMLVERVMDSIREVNSLYGTTIVLVEQNLKQGLAVAHRAVFLKSGEKRFDGPPDELRDERRLVALF